MFTDSGICWVLCSVSAFTFRWFPLQGGEEHWLSGYAVRSKTTEYLLKRGILFLVSVLNRNNMLGVAYTGKLSLAKLITYNWSKPEDNF